MRYVMMLYEFLKTQLRISADDNDSRIIGTILKLLTNKQHNIINISPVLRDNLYVVLLLMALNFNNMPLNVGHFGTKLAEKTDNEILNTLNDVTRIFYKLL